MLRLTRLICLQEPRRPFAGRRRIAAAGVLTYHSSSSSAAIFSCRASPPNARPPSAMDSSAIHGTGYPAAADGMQPGPTVSSESSAGRTGKVPAAGIEEGAAADDPPEGAGEARPVPEEILKSAVHLQCDSSADGGVCDVYLVGTAHVSKESCREVEAIIKSLKPQVVFLELCSSRMAILTMQNLQVPSLNEMIDMWRKKKMNSFGILYSWFLAKVADKLEVLPGSEFRVAFEAAREYGARVILGDRPVQITLQRTWGKMSLWHRAKFVYHLLFQSVFIPSSDELNKMLKDMNEKDILTLMVQEMSTAFPTLMETLVHERDLYMSTGLLEVAREHNSVVAVVGKGHLAGIKSHWQEPVDVESLLEMAQRPSGVSPLKIISLASIAAAGVAIVYGIYFSGKK